MPRFGGAATFVTFGVALESLLGVSRSTVVRCAENFHWLVIASTALIACGPEAADPSYGGSGGTPATGSTTSSTGGGSGGFVGSGGGAAATGGAAASGGTNTAGGAASGGMTSGGTPSGGTPSGGASTGGAAASGGATGNGGSGSVNTGGVPGTGSAGNSGGAPSGGGATSGGGSTGGSSSGGAGTATGGSGACDFSDPPADVAAWIDQSWNAQLGNNIRSRRAWNLDHVMYDKGEMNVCVRWGATSAVPDTVRTNLAATVERWFNDWYKGLGAYGCFPYGAGIKVKITGWAVRPGRESLLGNVAPVPVYTETDADGEPKCPDACSEFVHWDHQFPSCPGGAPNHSDYWLWFDDKLPGGGGAAAVGGDWGLRMPVSTFVNAFNQPSYLVVEHEMGHGFGIQDYYDWTGARPSGGSIMIVGSTSGSQAPTRGDIWLLRRTWKEMKALRNW